MNPLINPDNHKIAEFLNSPLSSWTGSITCFYGEFEQRPEYGAHNAFIELADCNTKITIHNIYGFSGDNQELKSTIIKNNTMYLEKIQKIINVLTQHKEYIEAVNTDLISR